MGKQLQLGQKVGNVESAAFALWLDDARKQPHLDVERLWPRVADEYRRRATIALDAAGEA